MELAHHFSSKPDCNSTAEQASKMTMMMVWIVPAVLSPRVSPHWEPLLRSGFLVLRWKLSYVSVNTSADHSPGLRSIFLHGINLYFNSNTFVILTSNTFRVIRNLDFRHWAIFCISSNPSSRPRSSSSRGDVYSRHEPAHQNPAISMSRIVTTCFAGETFPIKNQRHL